jgi:carbonic anhydrase
VASLSPAVARAKEMPGDTVDQAIQINVKMTVEQLRNSEPVLARMIRLGKLKITGAYYSLDQGDVTWLPTSQ